MSNQVSIDVYIMLCGAEGTPDNFSLTRDGCISSLAEVSENYAVDLILHVRTDSFPIFDETPSNVTDEIVGEALGQFIDGFISDHEVEDCQGKYEGAFGDAIDEHIRKLPHVRREAAAERRGDMDRGH